MRHPDSTPRFHALDATRAFALLLGVVFHAAWSFLPHYVGAPIVDVSGHAGFQWFFFTAHGFRMQLFFLIAGFFGRLLVEKRGWAGLAINRLGRIGVPLVIGWFILSPLVIALWNWGANVSGRNLMPVPNSLLWEAVVAKGLMFVPQEQGGAFSLAHLWFLYYLLVLYAIALLLRAGIKRWVPENLAGVIASRWAMSIARSRWSLVWLTVATGLALWSMQGWHGVDTPIATLRPSVAVLMVYGLFFGVGWLLHRQSGVLPALSRYSRWQLAAGLVMSLVCCLLLIRATASGFIAGSITDRYPSLGPGQVVDWEKFSSRLKTSASAAALPELGNWWQALPASVRIVMEKPVATLTEDQKAGVCVVINDLLSQPGVFGAAPRVNEGAPQAPGNRRMRDENRAALERLVEGAIITNPELQPSYHGVKLIYSVAYAAMSWLLVMGTMGFFQARFNEPSRVWRYLADSAYWIYLVHLPLVVALQVWMADWNWPAVLKFPLLLAISFALLFLSYHYLVRSTFIGQVLNGRRYLFSAWPWSRGRERMQPPVTVPPAATAGRKSA